jgi:hypothetical protein
MRFGPFLYQLLEAFISNPALSFRFIKILLMQVIIELNVIWVVITFHQWLKHCRLVLARWLVVCFVFTLVYRQILFFELNISYIGVLFKSSNFLIKKLQILRVIILSACLTFLVRICLCKGISNKKQVVFVPSCRHSHQFCWALHCKTSHSRVFVTINFDLIVVIDGCSSRIFLMSAPFFQLFKRIMCRSDQLSPVFGSVAIRTLRHVLHQGSLSVDGWIACACFIIVQNIYTEGTTPIRGWFQIWI